MEIGWPTNVRHVAHVNFDRFNGFLGLPVEFDPDVPSKAPSASTTVFGVSTESMQLSYDHRGNSVPTILLLMQRRLYAQGGLEAEGIFRINADNGQEEFVRRQLNAGVVPEGIDVHCLAGLIKAWFRELPAGVLDTLSPEQVMQSQTKEECSALVRLLPPTEAALLDWAINLMADVVQHKYLNKMNARNIAMVFAPNMTQMAGPLTALMYAVQVMNFLKTLISKTLTAREDSVIQPINDSRVEPSHEKGQQGPSQLLAEETTELNENIEQAFTAEDPHGEHNSGKSQIDNISEEEYLSYATPNEESDGAHSETPSRVSSFGNTPVAPGITHATKNKVEDIAGQSSESKNYSKIPRENTGQENVVQAFRPTDTSKGISNLSRINSRTGRTEAWR